MVFAQLEVELECVLVVAEFVTFECEAANDDDHPNLCFGELRSSGYGLRDPQNRVEERFNIETVGAVTTVFAPLVLWTLARGGE